MGGDERGERLAAWLARSREGREDQLERGEERGRKRRGFCKKEEKWRIFLQNGRGESDANLDGLLSGVDSANGSCIGVLMF